MELDKDLLARQEARLLADRAEKAQAVLADFSQAQLDTIVEAVAKAFAKSAFLLAELAVKETLEFLLKSARRMLSDYEYSVLMYHIRGYRTADIAKRLSRTAKSIDNAKARIFKRLRGAFGDITDL